MDGARLFFGPAGESGFGGFGGSVLPFCSQDVHGQRRQRCEVVSAPSRGGQPGGAENGRPRLTSWRARGIGFWRGSSRSPDLTLRALLKELAGRGLVVSYYALWHFLQHEGVTFKKKPSRLRAGSAGHRQAA